MRSALIEGNKRKSMLSKGQLILNFGYDCIVYLQKRLRSSKTPDDIKDKIALACGSKLISPESGSRKDTLIFIGSPKVVEHQERQRVSVEVDKVT